MQSLISKLNDTKISNDEKQKIYIKIIQALCNKDAAYYCVLDPNMILEDTSIPYVIDADGVKKALCFSKLEFATKWA